MAPFSPFDGASQPERGPRRLLVAVGALGLLGVIAGGAAVAYLFLSEPDPTEAPAELADASVVELDASVPPRLSLEEGEARLQELAAGWSSDKGFARWLRVSGLISALASAVNLVAGGESPAPVLTFISLRGSFGVDAEKMAKPPKSPGAKKGRGKKHKKVPAPPQPRTFISEKSYKRYNEVTRVFTSVDADMAGKGYAVIRPYLESAYQVIGAPGTRFDDQLVAAIKRLLSVSLLDGEVEVVSKGAVFAFKDPTIEALSPAEKNLLRMGPGNGKAVQEHLRKFAASAGLDLESKPGQAAPAPSTPSPTEQPEDGGPQ